MHGTRRRDENLTHVGGRLIFCTHYQGNRMPRFIATDIGIAIGMDIEEFWNAEPYRENIWTIVVEGRVLHLPLPFSET